MSGHVKQIHYGDVVPTIRIMHIVENPKKTNKLVLLGFLQVCCILKCLDILDKRVTKLENQTKEQNKDDEEIENDLCKDLEEEFLK